MRIHYLQHVAFEGLGSMEAFLKSKGHHLSSTQLYNGELLPVLEEIDLLIVMGGPMGVYDDDKYPWLAGEKEFIRDAIGQGKKVLGICLGAQQIAAAMGARVSKNPHREIGWFKVKPDDKLEGTILSEVFTAELEVFHWHGDTFELPDNTIHIASSEACQNQGFIYDNRVIALQFHLETTYDGARALIKHCSDELDGSAFVQSADEMLGDPAWFMTLNHSIYHVLEVLGA